MYVLLHFTFNWEKNLHLHLDTHAYTKHFNAENKCGAKTKYRWKRLVASCHLALLLWRTQTFSISPALFFYISTALCPIAHATREIEWGLVCEHMLPDCANPNGRDVVFVHFVQSYLERYLKYGISCPLLLPLRLPPPRRSALSGSFLLTRIYTSIRIEFTSRTHKPHTHTQIHITWNVQ